MSKLSLTTVGDATESRGRGCWEAAGQLMAGSKKKKSWEKKDRSHVFLGKGGDYEGARRSCGAKGTKDRGKNFSDFGGVKSGKALKSLLDSPSEEGGLEWERNRKKLPLNL